MYGLKRSIPTRMFSICVAFLLSLAFYVYTLAPTILYADDAKFQRLAYFCLLQRNVFDHPIWVALIHPIVFLPVGDVAYRVNLASALCGAATVGLVFALLWRATGSSYGAAGGAAALAVSHTFWTHSVRTEVYTFNSLILVLCLWLLLSESGKGWALLLLAVVLGIGMGNHLMLGTALPGLALGAILQGRRLRIPRKTMLGIAAVLIIVSAASAVLCMSIDAFSTIADLVRGQVMTLADWGAQLSRSVLLLGLQFPSVAALLILPGLLYSFRQRWFGLTLLLIFIGGLYAGLRQYQALDQYVFFFFSYVVGAIWIGYGYAWLAAHLVRLPGKKELLLAALLLLSVLMPIAVYSQLPAWLRQSGFTGTRLGIREIPGRDSLTFYFWPSKRGYTGARWFAETVMDALPDGAILIVDYPLSEPFRYLQSVERRRPDVTLAQLSPAGQLPFVREHYLSRPIFLADTQRYYDIDGLSKEFEIVPRGLVYELVKRE
jgi:hypothetical protein